MSTTIKVAIVEDDEGIRSSLAAMIKRASGLELVAQFGDGESAVKEIPGIEPNVVLMDVNLPGMKGFECVRQLNSECEKVQFLMLTVTRTARPSSTRCGRVPPGICSSGPHRLD